MIGHTYELVLSLWHLTAYAFNCLIMKFHAASITLGTPIASTKSFWWGCGRSVGIRVGIVSCCREFGGGNSWVFSGIGPECPTAAEQTANQK